MKGLRDERTGSISTLIVLGRSTDLEKRVKYQPNKGVTQGYHCSPRVKDPLQYLCADDFYVSLRAAHGCGECCNIEGKNELKSASPTCVSCDFRASCISKGTSQAQKREHRCGQGIFRGSYMHWYVIAQASLARSALSMQIWFGQDGVMQLYYTLPSQELVSRAIVQDEK